MLALLPFLPFTPALLGLAAGAYLLWRSGVAGKLQGGQGESATVVNEPAPDDLEAHMVAPASGSLMPLSLWGSSLWPVIMRYHNKGPSPATIRPRFEVLFLDSSGDRGSYLDEQVTIQPGETLEVETNIPIEATADVLGGRSASITVRAIMGGVWQVLGTRQVSAE